MSFGTRLILFFTLTLLLIELSTGAAIRSLLRDMLVDDGKARVVAADTRFGDQLQEFEATMANGVRLLTLDFALRRAIADRDGATVVSALRNHGRRIVGRLQLCLRGADQQETEHRAKRQDDGGDMEDVNHTLHEAGLCRLRDNRNQR